MAFFAGEYVDIKIAQRGLKLSRLERVNFVSAVKIVIEAGATPKPLDVGHLHFTLTAGNVDAGKYREALVYDPRLNMVKDLPHFRAIPTLMRRFHTSYRGILKNPLLLFGERLQEVIWMVAANGRCLHPFVIRNTDLFDLIEHHMSQVLGLPWQVEQVRKERFDYWKGEYKIQNKEHYKRVAGT